MKTCSMQESAQQEQSASFFSEPTALRATQEPSGECSEHRDWQTPTGLPFQKTAGGVMLCRSLGSHITRHHRCDVGKKVSYKTRAPL